MAIKPLNSVAGYSVGEYPSTVIILANGDITTTNVTTTGVANLNAIGNVKISGGSSGQLIQTDGDGNLSFVTISTSSLTNGNSNIQVLNNANITFNSTGNSNVVVISGTGVNVSGYLTATGNITSGNANLGNAALANYFIGSGNNLSNIQGANVSGAVAYATTANSVAGANVSGEVAYAAVANSVAGANVSGAVAYATTANNVAGANVSGTVSSATNASAVLSNTSTNTTVYLAGTSTSANGNVSLEKVTGIYANMSNNAITATTFVGTLSGAATTAGTVTTAAQPNITSVGTLNSLNVSATVNATSFSSNVATGTAPLTVQSTTLVANLNADLLDGYNTDVANTASTIVVRDANGNVSANYFKGDGSQLTGIDTSLISNGNSNVSIPSANGNVNITAVGNTTMVITGTGANITGYANVSGNVTAGNVYANSGTIGAQTLKGEGGNISNIQGANVSGTVSSASTATTAGTVTTAAQPNITSVGTLSSLDVTANITAGNVYANTGTIGALTLKGEGGNISNIQGANVSGTVASATAATNASAVLNNVSSTGTVYPTFISSTANGNYSLTSNTAFTANIANGFFGATLLGGTLTTAAQPNITSVGTLSALSVTGNITSGNVYANSGIIGANTLTAIGNVNAGNANITSNLTANFITSTNGISITNGPLTISAGNLDVTGNLNVTGNVNYSNVTDLVVGDPLIYIGANNTGDLYDLGIVASYNDGTYYHTGIARNHTTDTWTFFDGVVNEPTTVIDWANATYPTVKLGNLVATANANIAGYANVVGNISAGNVNAGNLLTANYVSGTLTTAAQPNITSVGTLGSLAVTANITSGNIYANSGIIGAQTLKGEGGNISNIQGANVSGTVASATTATTAGTVTTAAQPNITSVGTLTSLSVSGNISSGNISGTNGNLTTANISGNVVLGNASVTTKISWGSVTTSAVTANQTIASFSVTGVTGIEFLVKGVDATGSKYSVATVTAVTDGTSVDYSTFGTVNLGGYTGTLAVNVTGSVLYLQVTPASSNSTVWTTQYRFI